MNSIKKNKVQAEIKNLKSKLKGFVRHSSKTHKILTQLGYSFEITGTGGGAYTQSMEIGSVDFSSNKYLNGSFLQIGASNQGCGKGVYYRAYVKKIIN